MLGIRAWSVRVTVPVSWWCGSGCRWLDEYLEFLAGRCRPNTVLAAAYDLKVFFTVVGKPPRAGPAGRCAGVHHRAAHRRRRAPALQPSVGGEPGGVSAADGAAAAVERVGAVRVPAGPRRRGGEPGAAGAADPAGAVSGPARASRWSARPRTLPRILAPAEVDALTGGAAHAPGPGDGRGDGAGRAAPLRGPRAAAGGPAGRASGGCSSPRARAATSG